MLQTFPDIDEMYKQRTLARLIEKEQWAVAATYSGQDKNCQVSYVYSLVRNTIKAHTSMSMLVAGVHLDCILTV